MMSKLDNLKDGITIAGDGRHDSMGHSAMYCVYTLFCHNIPQILHFNIMQVRMS